MNIFLALALNVLSFAAIACMVHQNGFPHEKWEMITATLFFITPMFSIHYMVGSLMPSKTRGC